MPRHKRFWVDVNGKAVSVPFIHHPFYPSEKVRWTLAPDPRDTERYFAWGRRHFGAEWYRRRRCMLKERNIYVHIDHDYKRKQDELRKIENAVEGRLFPDGMLGAVWKHVWQQINGHTYNSSSGSDMHMLVNMRSTSTQLTRPLLDSAWDQLEHDRTVLGWNTEEFEYNKCVLKTRLIGQERKRVEDAIGDSQLQEEREKLAAREQQLRSSRLARRSPAYERMFDEYNRLAERFRKLLRGIPLEDADREYLRSEEAASAYDRTINKLILQVPKAQEELMQKLMHWQNYGLAIDEQDWLVAFYGLGPISRPDYTSDPEKFNDYDYLSLCKRTPLTRPKPGPQDMSALVTTWSEGLILNNNEIKHLLHMHGYYDDLQVPIPPQPRNKKTPNLKCRRELASLKDGPLSRWPVNEHPVMTLRSGTYY